MDGAALFVDYQLGFGQVVPSLTQGQSITATVSLLEAGSASQYRVFWGDGSNYTGPEPTATHAFSSLGSYVLSAQALAGSTWLNGPTYLYPIVVNPDSQTTFSGFYPTLSTTFSNSSPGTIQFGWLSGSGAVSVSATYTFSAAGLYYITMVGAVTAPTGTVYQNYTWTVYISPPEVSPGCSQCGSGGPHSQPQRRSQLVDQEVAPGGAISEDPSVAYDSISEDPILNVYQTLVTYNGSSTAGFVPELSLCVPGSTGGNSCQAKFGDSLIVNNGASPEYWTFPIDKAARFYDPSTGANWSVYPSDVMFTFARSCGFSDLPGYGSQPGWIQCQSLLPPGNPNWDGGIHSPLNNTPQNVLGSMLINASTYCPSSIMAVSNGCITFNAWGGNAAWPFFLQLVTDPLGTGVEPCGWFSASAQNAGVPGFPGTTAASGDGPCYLPGPAGSKITTTTDPTFTNWLVHTTPPTYWDTFQGLTSNTPGIQPGVQWNMVGSGPYYLTNQPFQKTVGYTLAQNPAYAPPTGCAGQPNCEPLPGPTHYAAKVTVLYQTSDTIGIEDYQAGQTDFATIEPSETPQMLSLIQAGMIGAIAVPTLNVFFLAFALEFNVTAAKSIDPNPLNIPGDFFNYVGLRQFLVNAFPYTTVENTIFTTDGIQYGFNYGGAIPQYMGNYYPTNISWPNADPVATTTTVGSAGWWWTQATTSGSPYYDPELAACTTSSPCQFAIIGQPGATTVDTMIQDYMPYISQISGGRLAPNTFDLHIGQLVPYGFQTAPGDSALPWFNLGWAPDYPDPTDYMAPLYYPDAAYTSGDALLEGLSLFTCSGSNDPVTDASMAGLLYWANQPHIAQACEGNAYAAMVWGMDTAAGMAVGPARVLMYNLVEHIANGLALYVYYDQESLVVTYASWINPTTISTNPVIGGGGDNTWYTINGSGVLSS